MYIALLEDEHVLAADVRQLLSNLGHTVVHFSDGHKIMQGLLKDTFDLFVLDWHVPGPDGLQVLQHLREHRKLNTPVIFLTAEHDEHMAAKVLHAGADDYCVKPLRGVEFSARILALQRRVAAQSAVTDDGELFPGYVFDAGSRTVMVNGTPIALTEKEFDLGRLLFLNMDRPLARGRIMREVWGRDEASLSRTLDVHISWIRRKLNIGAESDRIRLMVVHGFGYRLMKLVHHQGESG